MNEMNEWMNCSNIVTTIVVKFIVHFSQFNMLKAKWQVRMSTRSQNAVWFYVGDWWDWDGRISPEAFQLGERKGKTEIWVYNHREWCAKRGMLTLVSMFLVAFMKKI